MTKRPDDDRTTARPHDSTKSQARLPYSPTARKHESTGREARPHDRPTAQQHHSTKRKARMRGSTIHEQILIVGQLTVLVGVLIAVGLSSAYLGMRLAVRGTEVEVPSIAGKPVGEATEILERVHLKREVMGERFDPEIPRGVVISQHPQPGRTMKEERKVQIILSLGTKTHPVPDLRGSPLRVARLMASDAGFELGNISEISMSEIPKGQIVQQFPPPDSKDLLSPEIDVLVSGGFLERYVMPDVTGQSLNSVVLYFEKNAFKLGNIRYGDYPDAARGAVVKQFPEPGYLLTEQETINLEVAR
ncbi:MAG: PASTA domain-containing protein [Acidobacteria bacterium]|nr:MAG: PASTA domain-containing protein [Acidobacteriota bacterium]